MCIDQQGKAMPSTMPDLYFLSSVDLNAVFFPLQSVIDPFSFLNSILKTPFGYDLRFSAVGIVDPKSMLLLVFVGLVYFA